MINMMLLSMLVPVSVETKTAVNWCLSDFDVTHVDDQCDIGVAAGTTSSASLAALAS